MTRRKNDFYPTPATNTEILLKNVSVTGTVVEACSGKNHITEVLQKVGLEVITNDIDVEFDAQYHFDAKGNELYNTVKADWFITNPPFNQAFPILTKAYEHFDNIALLLRISFLEPTYERGSWLEAHPPTKLIVLPRTSFTGDGKTDSVTCCWILWQKHLQQTPSPILVSSKG